MKELLQMALDALEVNYSDYIYDGAGPAIAGAFESDIAAIRDHLAAPQPEPVAYTYDIASFREGDVRGRGWVPTISRKRPMHDWMMRNLTPLVPADVPANLPGDMAIAEGTHQFMSRRYYNDETGRGWTEWAPYIPPKGLAKTLSAAPVVPLTDERLQKHAMRAGDCPPGSMVVLLSSLRRMLSAAPVVPDGMALVPDYRGYAALGTGQYLLDISGDANPAELIIHVATDAEKEGRTVGDLRDKGGPGEVIQPEKMAVRLAFFTVAGLDALEQQLRILRETHFALSAAPVVRGPVIDEMDAIASQYAHKLALDLECVLSDYNGKWWDAAMQTLGAYREAMNRIHERESPTHMGEPVLPKISSGVGK